jgi:hypothetical protein
VESLRLIAEGNGVPGMLLQRLNEFRIMQPLIPQGENENDVTVRECDTMEDILTLGQEEDFARILVLPTKTNLAIFKSAPWGE